MRRYPLYIFDLDGTLYRGEEAIPRAAEVVTRLRSDGAAIRFLTNNSSTAPDDYKKKLNRLSIEAEKSEIYSSGTGSAARLRELEIRTVFVLGEPGLVAMLRAAGLDVVNADDDGRVQALAAKPDALLVGICRTFSYKLLNSAMQAGLSGARYFATNTDKTFPVEEGRTVPGAGSIVAAVSACLGREPEEVFGKPSPYLIELTLQEGGFEPADALVIGDRYETDIVAGQNAGCDTLMVLTGVQNEAPAGVRSADSLSILLD